MSGVLVKVGLLVLVAALLVALALFVWLMAGRYSQPAGPDATLRQALAEVKQAREAEERAARDRYYAEIDVALTDWEPPGSDLAELEQMWALPARERAS